MEPVWLGQFLKRKRNAVMLAPPEPETIRNTYLSEFTHSAAMMTKASTDSDEDDVQVSTAYKNNDLKIKNKKGIEKSSSSSKKNMKKKKKGIFDLARDIQDDIPLDLRYDDYESSDDGEIKSNQSSKDEVNDNYDEDRAKIKIFNLPYRMSNDQLSARCRALGCKFYSITMDIDHITGLPSGSATAYLQTDDTSINVVSKLNGANFQGRPARAVRSLTAEEQRRQRRLSGGDKSRYFNEDISAA